MSEVKHTPGPWFVSHSKAAISSTSKRVFKSVKTQKGIGGNIVANAFGGNGSEINKSKSIEEAEANAKLIAAAPELLEALKELLAKYHRVYGLAELPWEDYNGEVVTKAQAAIAKASPLTHRPESIRRKV